jgi:predicted transcriptional regulator
LLSQLPTTIELVSIIDVYQALIEKISCCRVQMLTNLDMDVLRTLLVAQEAGSFAKAAPLVGRSQSAVSLQMSKLER